MRRAEISGISRFKRTVLNMEQPDFQMNNRNTRIARMDLVYGKSLFGSSTVYV